MGGTAAVSDAVVDTLEDEGYTVDRVAGANRFETASDIAEEVGGTTAVLANGFSFADALAISPGAHALELPVLLTGAAELSDEAAGYIDSANVDTVIIVGGTAVVSQSIQDELEDAGIDVTRLAGTNRYETGVEIAEFHLDNGFSADELVLATGEKFADALAGGPMASQLLAPMILTQTDVLTPVTQDFIEAVAPEADTIYILGGTAAVSQAVEDAAAAAAQVDGPPVGQTATTRPELVSASIVQTTSDGTTVRFTFDEALTGTFVNEGNFHVYSFDWDGDGEGYGDEGDIAQVVDANTTQVLVTFPEIDSSTLAAGLSVATVDEDAVRGVSGADDDRNVTGDAPLNPGTTSMLTAGVTAAPDLVSVGNFRPNPANVNTSLVDFTFDQPATVDNPWYSLISVDGVTENDTGVPVAGDGTAVHTVRFDNNPDALSTVTITAASIARGVVYEDSVEAPRVSTTRRRRSTCRTTATPRRPTLCRRSRCATRRHQPARWGLWREHRLDPVHVRRAGHQPRWLRVLRVQRSGR